MNKREAPWDWPRVRMRTEGRSVAATFKILSDQHRAAWRKHPHTIRLLEDHYPLAWSKNEFVGRDGHKHGQGVAWCRHYHDKATRREEDGVEEVTAWSCNQVPQCPACNDVKTRKRGWDLLRKIVAATPEKEVVQAQLITLAVSEKPDAPSGITQAASKEWHKLRDAAYRVVEWMYGPGVGAFATYQDYGEQLLYKKRPHVHLLVHLWREKEGEPERLPIYDLHGSGRKKLDEEWFRQLQTFFPQVPAQHSGDLFNASDLDVRFRDNPGRVSKSAKYVVREMIDFRKLQYDRFTQRVKLEHYKPDMEKLTVFVPVQTVKDNLVDYTARCASWGHRGRPSLHAAYGNMADKVLKKTIEAIGRHEEHWFDCGCRECSTWRGFWEDAPVAPKLKA